MKLECPLTLTRGSNTELNTINIVLVLGYKCNYHCVYCYEKNSSLAFTDMHMTEEVINSSINFIKDLINDTSDTTKINLVFEGGEPTLYMDILDPFIEALGSYSKVDKLVLNTNGSNLHKYLKKFQYINNKFDNKLFINVSYDYFLQNKNRQDYSYKKVRDNILLLDKNYIDFDIKTTLLHEDLIYIHEVYKDYYEFNKQLTNKVDFNFTLDITNSTNIDNISIFDINDSFKLLIEFLRDNNIGYTGINCFDNTLEEYKTNCNIPINSIAIDYTGQIYPCVGTVFSKDSSLYSLDNIKEKEYKDIKHKLFKKQEIIPIYLTELEENTKKCNTCRVRCNTCSLYSTILSQEDHNQNCNATKLFQYYGSLFRNTNYLPKDKNVSIILSQISKEEIERKKLVTWIEGRISKFHRLINEYNIYGIRRHPDIYPEVLPILQERAQLKKQRLLEEINKYKQQVKEEKAKLRSRYYNI